MDSKKRASPGPARKKVPGKRRRSLRTLTPRARRFITQYLLDLNGTQAAIRAGYSPTGARSWASKMLRNVVVARAVNGALAKSAEANREAAENHFRELAAVAFFDPARLFDGDGHLLPVETIPPAVRRAVSAFEIRYSDSSDPDSVPARRVIRFTGKLNALLALAKPLSILNKRNSNRL